MLCMRCDLTSTCEAEIWCPVSARYTVCARQLRHTVGHACKQFYLLCHLKSHYRSHPFKHEVVPIFTLCDRMKFSHMTKPEIYI